MPPRPTAIAVFPGSRPRSPPGCSQHALPVMKDIQHGSCTDPRTKPPARSTVYPPLMTDTQQISFMALVHTLVLDPRYSFWNESWVIRPGGGWTEHLKMMEKLGSYQITSAHRSVNTPAGKQAVRSGPRRKAKFVWVRPARPGGPYPYEGFWVFVLPKIGRLNRQLEAIFSRLGARVS